MTPTSQLQRRPYSNFKLAFFPDKLNALADGRVTAPIYVRIKPFNACNHSCSWCGYGHGEAAGQSMHTEIAHKDSIPRDKMIETLRDLKAIGTKAITWTGGGEPMLYPHFVEAQSEALSLGLDTSIITNGQSLCGAKAVALLPAEWVRVSIDYHNAESMAASRRVRPAWFDAVDKNLRDFAADPNRTGDLEVNFIVTRGNHNHLLDAATWLRGCGVDNVRFSPVWMDNFEAYHDPIRDAVEGQLADCEAFQNDDFKVYSSYRISDAAQRCSGTRCYFQQVVSVIGADQNVYACKDTAYSTHGRVGSIKDRKFSELWFSPETKAFFDGFNPMERCHSHQCAAAAKNRIYEEMVHAGGCNFV